MRTTGNQRRFERVTLRRVAFIRAAQRVGLSLDEVAAALATLPEDRTPTAGDWSRLSRAWRARLDEQIERLERLRDKLDGCIGCGCLSLRTCALNNPSDGVAAEGPGPSSSSPRESVGSGRPGSAEPTVPAVRRRGVAPAPDAPPSLFVMALRIVTSRPDPAIVTLPWSTPLEEWTNEYVVPLPRGLSRHVVRIVRLRDRTYAIKETQEDIAFREYRLLRDLQRMGLPSVVPQGVITGRVDADGEPLPAALLTQHLQFSLPYRSPSDGLTADNLPSLVDALVVLLVRLHLADFFWGDVSLSNVLFRRDAGGFAAYLVDAETGELNASSLSDSMREYDLTVATENVFAELLDLQASESLNDEVQAHEIVELLDSRYHALWSELTAAGAVLRR